MDNDCVEIVPPIGRGSNSKSLKQKEVVQEIIDIDMIEDSNDLMVVDGNGNPLNKGKTLANFLCNPTAVNLGSAYGVQTSKSFSPRSQNAINLDGYVSDIYYDVGEYLDKYADDFAFDDDYTFLQSQFDNVNIPAGVEAPITWLEDPSKNKPATAFSSNDLFLSGFNPESVQFTENQTSVGGKNFQNHLDGTIQSHQLEPPFLEEPAQSKQELNTISSSLPAQKYSLKLPPEAKSLKSLLLPCGKRKPNAGNSSSHHSKDYQDGLNFALGLDSLSPGNHTHESSKKHVGTNNLNSLNSNSQLHLPRGLGHSMSWLNRFKFKKKQNPDKIYSNIFDPLPYVHSVEEAIPWVQDMAQHQKNGTATCSSTSISISNRKEDGAEDVLKIPQVFKQFGSVEDYADHHYKSKGSSAKQPPKNWAKKVQDDWRLLENDLPDAIFVRVYETRLDLLRAVIIGAEGTPYHDGLFFFDVHFPSAYPSVPPLVYYHSGGLRVNPNLYNCGKVCLSLLNTWSGNKKEMWIPDMSTMLQVLVSIQGLILNAKPYFNEPAYARMGGSTHGEKRSYEYNENTLLLSLKTMIYTIKKPPKHFEDFVVSHFRNRAHDILVACKAYMDGAQVGCLVKGGVQDVDEGDQSCSKKFKASLAVQVKQLIAAFMQIGIKDCEKFLSQ